MKLTTFLIALLIMVSAFAFVTWKRLAINLEESLVDHAGDINANAPIVVDPHTDMIGARAEGKEIVYQFRVHGLSAETMARSEEHLRAGKIAFAQGDENITRLLKDGATLTYEFFVGNDLALRFSIDHSAVES